MRFWLFIACTLFCAPFNARADVKVKAKDGTSIVEIKEQAGALESFITIDGKQLALTAKAKDPVKRLYKVNGKDYEVKTSDDGFKLKDTSGKLLWKIKLKEDKLKISDNEENEHPFELKRKAADRIGVERNEQDIGKVTYDAATTEVTVKSASGTKIFQGSYSQLCYFFGILLLDQVPVDERAIVLTELALKNL